ncbi:MAG: DUF4296 domain-containing protein [Bacteroidales bacterium]|nr:DUF4296 domain-containing protein [Bacteroidales bacterium]
MLSLCCLYSCTRTYESSTPKDLIDKQQMEDILVEIFMTEASVRNCVLTNQMDSLDIWTAQQMNAVLEKKNVSYTRFINNYNYYMGHEDLSKELMEQVVNRLVKMETEATIEVQKSRKQTTTDLKNIKSDVKTIQVKK